MADVTVTIKIDTAEPLHRIRVRVNGIHCGSLTVGELASAEIAKRLLQPSESVKAALDALRWWQKVDTLMETRGAGDPATWDTIEIARTATQAALAPYKEASDDTR